MPKETQEEQERRQRREREQLAPDRVLVGNVELFTKALKACLVDDSSFMHYDALTDEVELHSPDLADGPLLRIKVISRESATRLAEGLGLLKKHGGFEGVNVDQPWVTWSRH